MPSAGRGVAAAPQMYPSTPYLLQLLRSPGMPPQATHLDLACHHPACRLHGLVCHHLACRRPACRRRHAATGIPTCGGHAPPGMPPPGMPPPGMPPPGMPPRTCHLVVPSGYPPMMPPQWPPPALTPTRHESRPGTMRAASCLHKHAGIRLCLRYAPRLRCIDANGDSGVVQVMISGRGCTPCALQRCGTARIDRTHLMRYGGLWSVR